MRWTIVPRDGFREGLTCLQQWLLLHLVSQTPFDIWDLMLCEMEDVILEGFRGKRHMPYAHWISYLLWMAIKPMPKPAIAEWSGVTTEFPKYDATQLVRSVSGRTPSRPSHRPEVLETAAEQDAIVRDIAVTELAELEVEGEGAEIASDPSNSTNEDYQSIPEYRPRAHDVELVVLAPSHLGPT